MKDSKRIYLISFLFYTVCIFISSGGTDQKNPKERVLHFPKDRSLGMIKVKYADIVKKHIQDYHDWYLRGEHLGEAQGDVIIPVGKKVALFLYRNALKDLSPLLYLKPDDLYMLSNVPLPPNRNYPLPPENMQHITHLSGLKTLWISQTTATTESIKHIAKLQSLEMLVPPKGLTNRGLSCIAQITSLKGLYFVENRINNAGLKHYLPRLTKLEKLSLWSGRISDDGLECLADLPRLFYLSLNSGNFTDAGMAHVRKCSSLRILDLMHLPITDAGLQRLSGHTKLESLLLYNTQVTDRGLVFLKSMPSLKKLDVGKRINKSQITDAGMVHLAQISTLEHLRLPGGITDKGIAHISKLKNLKYLRGGGDSDAALQQLSKLQSLEYLSIGGSDITDAGMEHLSKLTNLKELGFSSNLITNEGLAKLKTLKSLERLNLDCKNITITGLSYLNALPNLIALQVRSVKQNGSALDVSGLTKLEDLRIRGITPTPIHDKDLACLAKLKRLRFLAWLPRDSKVTDAGISYLKDLPDLRELQAGSPYLTDKSLSYLTSIKTLNYLIITGNFTDEGLSYLEELKALRHLKIYSANNFSPAALKQLKEKLPYLRSLVAKQNRELKKMSKTKPKPSMDNTVAPFFAVKTLDDKRIKLEDYRGKVLVLYFWATWCRPCVAGTPELKNIYTDLKTSFGDDFELISLSMDDNDSLVREHIKKYGLTWPQARIGLNSKMSSDYKVNDAVPKYFLIGPEGKILLTPESPQVDTKSFIEEVLKNRKT